MGAATQLDLFWALRPEPRGRSDSAGDAQAAVASAAEREGQAKYRGESLDDGDLGSVELPEYEDRHERSFYHPYG